MYYRYRDKLFKYYDLEKEYLDGYFVNVSGFIKDESQSKIFYRYKLIENSKNPEIKEKINDTYSEEMKTEK